MDTLLIYGANGYSGRLIAEEAVRRGLAPILAGRGREALQPLGRRLGCEVRQGSLDDGAALDGCLRGVSVVLHCAGPFSATSRPMLDACLRAGAHYLDITGEYLVMEAVAARDAELRAAGLMAMCGTGMDVVPTDCLAAHMKARLPSATQLEIYVRGLDRVSPGTAQTMIESAGLPNVVRENGRLVEKPAGADRRRIDFPEGKASMVGSPWGDIASAWRTTGIPNIRVYMSLMPGAPLALRASRPLHALLQMPGVQDLLKAAARRFIAGPNAEQRANAHCEFIAVATDARGNARRSHLKTREGYAFTVLSASDIARRVMAGEFKPGYQTPGGLYGADYVLQFDGSERHDLD